jgi:hypothetical protein
MKRFCTLAFALALLTFTCKGQGQAPDKGLTVGIASQKPLLLHFTLKSGSSTPVEIFRSQVPWATRYSVVLAVVKANGECLEKVLAIEDPPVGKISVNPEQALTGDLNLEVIFKGLDEARKKSDLHLFWAYQAPDQLKIGGWSGGWILVPRNP